MVLYFVRSSSMILLSNHYFNMVKPKFQWSYILELLNSHNFLPLFFTLLLVLKIHHRCHYLQFSAKICTAAGRVAAPANEREARGLREEESTKETKERETARDHRPAGNGGYCVSGRKVILCYLG